MNYWLGVIGAANRIEHLTDDPLWCFVSRRARAGDVLLIYVASHLTAPDCARGIVAMYEIIGPAPDRAGEVPRCAQSSMGGGPVVSMRVALLERFAVPLSGKDLWADQILRKSRYFRCNFRGICFRVTAHQYVQIRRLIAAKGEAHSGHGRLF